MRQAAALLAILALAGCNRGPATPPRYLVGQGYSMGGLWSYPREDFAYREAGLAAVLPARDRRTANGEAFEPGALMAAHRTLQLPAIVTVTNLENGRELAVRVNDRGPQNPGRIIGLSRRAAQLLGVPEGGTAQVRVAVEQGPSRALAGQLPGNEASRLQIATVERASVQAESLAPLDGTRSAARQRQAAAGPVVVAAEAEAPAAPPARLPEVVRSVAASPGVLLVEAGTFFRRDLAQQQAARLASLGARVEAFGPRGQVQYRVRMGPFGSVAQADGALQGVVRAGLPEARILVE